MHSDQKTTKKGSHLVSRKKERAVLLFRAKKKRRKSDLSRLLHDKTSVCCMWEERAAVPSAAIPYACRRVPCVVAVQTPPLPDHPGIRLFSSSVSPLKYFSQYRGVVAYCLTFGCRVMAVPTASHAAPWCIMALLRALMALSVVVPPWACCGTNDIA